MVAQAHPHPAIRRTSMIAGGILATITAAALVLLFIVLVAELVQHVLGLTVSPAIGTARSTFWWIISNRDLPP